MGRVLLYAVPLLSTTMNYVRKNHLRKPPPGLRDFKRAQVVGLKQPQDGFTKEEETIYTLLTDHTIASLYAKLPTPRMKAIVALHFELGYPQTLVAEIFGVAQPTIVDEIELIRQVLKGRMYKPKKKPKQVKSEDLLKLMWLLGQQ